MKITDFTDAEEGLNFDRMWKRPSRPRCFCDGYVVIGEAIRPRDILLAGDAHIPKFSIANRICLHPRCGVSRDETPVVSAPEIYRTPVAEVKLNPVRAEEVRVLTTCAARVPGDDVVTSTSP